VIPSALVLLPGLEGTGTLFANLVAALPRTLNVSIVRYPTQQFLSYSELVVCVKDAVPSGVPYVLVAESFATPLAVKFAATHPKDLAGLVIGGGFVTNPSRRKSWLVRAMARPLLFHLFSPPRSIIEHFLIGSDAPPVLESSILDALKLVNPTVLAMRIRAVLDCDARQELGRTDIPIVYIQAERDNLVGPECFEEIRSIRPDTMLATIPCPHLIFGMEPRKAAQIIVEFISQMRA
jgi:pimeloyl-[acyl-carrier protein] methyl ester esterase